MVGLGGYAPSVVRLKGVYSTIELQTLIWWVRLVSIQLLPKETDLQSAAVADLLLTHITFALFKILCELNYEMLTIDVPMDTLPIGLIIEQ